MSRQNALPNSIVMDDRPTEVKVLKESKAAIIAALQETEGDVSLPLFYPKRKSKYTRADLHFLHAVGIKAD